MKKRLLCLFLALTLAIAPLAVSADQGAVIRCHSPQGQPGDYLYFPVTAENLENLAALELSIFYDPQVLEYAYCSNGWLLDSALASTNHREGEITLTAVSAEGISGSGELLYLSFLVKQDCPQGRYPINLAVGEAYDVNRQGVTIAAKNGWVTVTEYTPSYSQFYLDLMLSADTVTAGETFTATVCNAWWLGFSSCDLTVCYDPTLFRLVDAKVCGEMENTLYSINTGIPGLVRLTCASAQDTWCYEMLELTLQALDDAMGTTQLTAEIADVYNTDRIPYRPYSTEKSVTVRPAESIVHPRLRLEGSDPIRGETTEMTLVLDACSGLAAADFELTYDPGLLECIDVQPAGGGQYLLINPNYKTGSIRFSFVEEQGAQEELPLVNITWRAKSGADRHYAVSARLTDPVDAQFRPVTIECPEFSGCIRIRQTLEPTCEEPGGEELRCIACGDVIPLEPQPPLGHSYGKPAFTWAENFESCEARRVCARDGSHIWKVDCTVTHESTGSSCTEPGSITYTATADFYGEVFTDTRRVDLDVLGHDYDWVVLTEPGCESSGLRQGTCIRCGSTTRETLAPLGHDHRAQVTAPGCTEGGYTTHTCTRCGNRYTDSYTDPTGHHYEWFRMEEPTCTADGWEQGRCAGCGDTQTRILPALDHDWDGTVCRRCGETRVNPFTDIAKGAFYYNPVLWAVENGITAGMTSTTFEPDSTCTRGQVVTFLWRAAGKPEPTSTKHPFTDVNPKAYYYKAMLWAVENGITAGMTSTTFAPDRVCTRGQVVTFLWRSKGQPEPSSSTHPFKDVNAKAFYYKAMLWAVENQITAGMTSTTFAPDRTCTRGQVVTFLYRTFK